MSFIRQQLPFCIRFTALISLIYSCTLAASFAAETASSKRTPAPSHRAPPPLAVLYDALYAEMKAGGVVIYVITPESAPRPEAPTMSLQWRDCNFTPRLTKRGLADAEMIGDAIRRLDIAIDGATTDQICTSLDAFSAMAKDPYFPFRPTSDLNPAALQREEFGYADGIVKIQAGLALKTVVFSGSNGIAVAHTQPAAAAVHPAAGDAAPGDIFLLKGSHDLTLLAKLTPSQLAEMAKYVSRTKKATRPPPLKSKK
jgi:hypothetical protein